MHLPTPKERPSLTCAGSAVAMSFSVPLSGDGDALIEPTGGEGGAELLPRRKSWEKNPRKKQAVPFAWASVQGKEQPPLFLWGFSPWDAREGSASHCPAEQGPFPPS